MHSRFIRRLTCMGCGDTQRVVLTIAEDGSQIVPPCSSCSQTNWMALPALNVGHIEETERAAHPAGSGLGPTLHRTGRVYAYRPVGAGLFRNDPRWS